MLKYIQSTDVGGRQINEDTIKSVSDGDNYLFVVCDGLGGHGMGDVASQLVADVFVEQFNNGVLGDGFLSDAFTNAQNSLIKNQELKGIKNKMRTTAAALFIKDETVYIGHVGDSRVYVIANNKVLKRTIDHSVPQMLALSGEIKECEIRNHPDRNILLRAMGTEWDNPMYDLMQPVCLDECQAFLLCSDGFWENIDEETMTSYLKKSNSVEKWVELMLNEVAKNGMSKRMDNVSLIAVCNPQFENDI